MDLLYVLQLLESLAVTFRGSSFAQVTTDQSLRIAAKAEASESPFLVATT